MHLIHTLVNTTSRMIWEGERLTSIEDVMMYYLKNGNIFIEFNPSYKFYSYLSEHNNKDAPETYSHMMNIYPKLMD